MIFRLEFEPTPIDCEDERCQIGPSYRSAIVKIYAKCVIAQIRRTITIPDTVTMSIRTTYQHGEQCPNIIVSCNESDEAAMEIAFQIEREFPESLDDQAKAMFARMESALDPEAMADDFYV